MNPFYPALESQASKATHPKVKSQIINIYKEIYKWLGGALDFAKLKDYYQKQLEEFISNYKSVKMVPKRRSNVEIDEIGGGGKDGGD